MRKKIEEELAKLAFGDLSADEASRLELRTQVDPEAAKTFESYRRMKDELQLLGQDVPEDQLSKERLRQAILTRGLKHSEPAIQRMSWIWMPVAAAFIAFGAFYLKGNFPAGGSTSTVVVDKTTAPEPNWLPEVGVVRPPKNDVFVMPETSRSPVVSSSAPTRVAMGSTRKSTRMSGSASRLANDPELPSGAAGLDMFDRSPMSASEPVESPLNFGKSAEPAPATSAAPAPTIIVIQTETDASTGTLKATEVGDTANVLVGG